VGWGVAFFFRVHLGGVKRIGKRKFCFWGGVFAVLFFKIKILFAFISGKILFFFFFFPVWGRVQSTWPPEELWINKRGRVFLCYRTRRGLGGWMGVKPLFLAQGGGVGKGIPKRAIIYSCFALHMWLGKSAEY
jgi:hypothetical protein